jgi:hypothetical protein
MTIEAIRRKTPEEFRAAVDGFDRRYVGDWDAWLAVEPRVKARLFGQILRKWQATRPKSMRRIRSEAHHGAPFLEDLLESAAEPLDRLGDLAVLTVAHRTARQSQALADLWALFSSLPSDGTASCVGITKAVLLLTDGRIGPAFDSNVREQIGAGRPETCDAWVEILEGVAEDIAAFESRNGPLAKAVSPPFAQLAYGRLYDMALGPRPRSRQGALRRSGMGRLGGPPANDPPVVATDVPRRSAEVRRPGLGSSSGGVPHATALPPVVRATGIDATRVVDRIKRRFEAVGPAARIPLLKGDSFTASIAEDGITVSNLATQPLLPWAVFEEAVTLLGRTGGHAIRGDAMNCKLGDDGLSLDSVEGHIAATVYGQRKGDSVFRRITPVACILIWAGVCGHSPGELVLLG